MKGNLRKDESILSLIDELKSRMGDDAFVVIDHWEGDLFAVGIARPDNHDVLAYVCTYEHPVESYVVSLELPAKPGSELPYIQGDELQVHGLDKLVEVIEKHFRTVE